MSDLVKRLRETGGGPGFPWTTMAEAADRIEVLERENMLARGSAGMSRQDWAYVCGKLAALEGRDPNPDTIPPGHQGTYCRGYDAAKGWEEGTALKLAERAALKQD